MSKCGCSPGSYDDGWHEKRSAECSRAEREAWLGLDGIVKEDGDD